MSFVECKCDHELATITIQRPQSLNALNAQVLKDLDETLTCVREKVSVVILTGAGEKAFVAGADILEMQKMSPLEARAFAEFGQKVFTKIEEGPFISIAAVNGFALGGGLELALACDLIYASKNAKLGLPETNLGIIPGFGGTSNLLKRIGFHRALEMILTGLLISADQAKSYGLVLDIFESSDLLPKTTELAGKFLKKGKHSMMAARRLLRSIQSHDRERNLLLERETFASLFAGGEPSEGMSAFIEKREPHFGGRT